jgi:hypothetical protein
MHAESWAVPFLDQLVRRKQEQRAGMERFWQRTRWLRFLTLPAFPAWLLLQIEMRYAEPFLVRLRERYIHNRLTRIDRFILECLWYQSLVPRFVQFWERIFLYYFVVFVLAFSMIFYFIAFIAIREFLR